MSDAYITGFRVSDIGICESLKVIAFAHEDYEPINKVGMLLNIIDTENFGSLTFWKYDPLGAEILQKINKLDFGQRISKLLQDKDSKVFIVGTDDGELHVLAREFALEKKKDKGHYRNKLISARIVGLSWVIQGKIIGIIGTDNFLKLFDISELKVVGGGSLNKRLQGASVISMEVDTSYRLFFATNKGTVMCYQVDPSTYKPTFLYTLTLQAEYSKLSITSLLFSCNNLFLVCGHCILVYNVGSAIEPKSVKL